MVDIPLPGGLPLPGSQGLGALSLTGQDLLIHCLTILPDAQNKLKRKRTKHLDIVEHNGNKYRESSDVHDKFGMSSLRVGQTH